MGLALLALAAALTSSSALAAADCNQIGFHRLVAPIQLEVKVSETVKVTALVLHCNNWPDCRRPMSLSGLVASAGCRAAQLSSSPLWQCLCAHPAPNRRGRAGNLCQDMPLLFFKIMIPSHFAQTLCFLKCLSPNVMFVKCHTTVCVCHTCDTLTATVV